MKKFQLVNWMPTKLGMYTFGGSSASIAQRPLVLITLDIPVRIPQEINLDTYLGKGRRDGELELDLDVAPGRPLPPSLTEL